MSRIFRTSSPFFSPRMFCNRTFALVLFAALSVLIRPVSAQSVGYTGIFGGGPIYKTPATSIPELETSGFTEVIVWSIEVSSTGDLNFNGEFPLTSNGAYIGSQMYPDFAANLAQLKQGTVKRITFSIGSSNYGDWEDIKALVDSQGTGPSSILYQDFAALKAAIPALDAIDFDDENSFDTSSTIAFGTMLGNLGLKVVPDAFDNNSYWENIVSQINAALPGTADGVHLQAYAGGAGNNPCQGWNFGAVPVWPGLWDQDDTPSQVQTVMTGWNAECGINGGFLWLYDDIVGTGLAAQYAAAINAAVSRSGFLLSGTTSIFLNQGASADGIIKITDLNGFSGSVTLTVSGLPKGVESVIEGTGNDLKLVLLARRVAATGFTTVTVTGTSGNIVQTLSIKLAVSAATSSTGGGTVVDISSYFNRSGIYTDGTVFSTGGIDGVGNAYSANLLGTSRVLSGELFNLGPANLPDAVSCEMQAVVLPQGQFSTLTLLGAAVNGNQLSQSLTVNYTDGSSTPLMQSFSDWYTPEKFAGEQETVAMAYRDTSNGTEDKRTFNLYAYHFALNSSKVVQGVTLPDDPNVVVLAATLH
jgi:hypothetical protein